MGLNHFIPFFGLFLLDLMQAAPSTTFNFLPDIIAGVKHIDWGWSDAHTWLQKGEQATVLPNIPLGKHIKSYQSPDLDKEVSRLLLHTQTPLSLPLASPFSTSWWFLIPICCHTHKHTHWKTQEYKEKNLLSEHVKAAGPLEECRVEAGLLLSASPPLTSVTIFTVWERD